jgi:hypothetical protein
MPMTKEQRIELLKLAREAKAKKKVERDEAKPEVKRGRKKKEVIVEPDINPEPVEEQEKVVEDNVVAEPVIEDPVKKPKPKKIKDPVNTLTLEMPDDQPDIIYETEIRRRPKKKIVKKIIYEDDSDDSVEEVIVDNRKKKASVKEVKKPVKLNEIEKQPEPEPVKKESSFNFFNC